MNKGALKNITKWIWLITVAGFVLYYAIRKKDSILHAISLLSWDVLSCAALFIFAAKLCLVFNLWLAAKKFSIKINLLDSYRMYNLSQLAKYIPGSIWQFVGRVGMLRERTVPGDKIRDSLLAEHLWVLLSAGTFGCFLVVISRPVFFEILLTKIDLRIFLLFIFVLFTFFAFVFLYNKQIKGWAKRLFPPFKVLPNLLCTWSFLGMSLWVTLHPVTETMPPLLYTIGIYSLGYAIGFLVPFAPAGLGIREAILCCALSPYMDMNQALVLAGINRIIYFLVEILAAFFCSLFTISSSRILRS